MTTPTTPESRAAELKTFKDGVFTAALLSIVFVVILSMAIYLRGYDRGGKNKETEMRRELVMMRRELVIRGAAEWVTQADGTVIWNWKKKEPKGLRNIGTE